MITSIPRKIYGFFKRKAESKGGKLFLLWIVYQAVKGTLTLSFIWIPLIYLWLKN